VATAVDVDVRALRPLAPRPAVPRRHRRQRRGRWVVATTLVLGYALQVLWRLWLVRGLNAPAAHGDEDGYLLAARILAGGPGGHSTQNGDFARYGYAVLITPAYWFGPDAFAVYRRVQLINALLSATVLPLSYLLARRALRLSPGLAIAAGTLAASLPAVAFYGEFALSDTVCAPLVLAWLLALHGWLAGTRPGARYAWAVGAGAAAGFGYLVHVRFTVVVAVHLGVAVLVAVRRLSPVGQAAASVVTAGAFAALGRVLSAAVGSALVLDGRSGTSHTVHMLTSPGGLSRSVVDGAGQVWYLMISTWGFGAVGLLVGGMALLRRIRRPDPAGVLLAAALASTLGVALVTAAALPADGRITYHAYPRYLAFLAPFWFLLGLAAIVRWWPGRLARRQLRHALALAGAAGAVICGLAALVVLRFHGELHREYFLAFDAPEASWLSGRWSQLSLLRTSLAAGGLLVLAVLALRSRRVAGYALVALLAVNLMSLAQITRRISEPMVRPQYANGTTLARLGVRDGDRVAVSIRVPSAVRYNDAREVSWAPLELFDDELQNPSPGASVVIAPDGYRDPVRNWDGARWGWYRIGGAPKQLWSAWRRAGSS
jgi:hypothetical protein